MQDERRMKMTKKEREEIKREIDSYFTLFCVISEYHYPHPHKTVDSYN